MRHNNKEIGFLMPLVVKNEKKRKPYVLKAIEVSFFSSIKIKYKNERLGCSRETRNSTSFADGDLKIRLISTAPFQDNPAIVINDLLKGG